MHRLAIVIPYYKIDFFEETLRSLAAQTDDRFTLYIGNDVSPNDPWPLIEKYFPKGCKYFPYQENVGGTDLAAQWERILDNVTEDWFQILGDDDMISENFVAAFYELLPTAEENKCSVLKFSHEWIDENNATIAHQQKQEGFMEPAQFILKKLNGEIRSSLSENIFKTEMYRKYRFERLPLAWGTDDLAIFKFADGKKILTTDRAYVSVRIYPNSISGSTENHNEKTSAENQMNYLLVSKYAKSFDVDTQINLGARYIGHCHIHKKPASYAAAWLLLKNFRFKEFLKILKKTYYINRMYA